MSKIETDRNPLSQNSNIMSSDNIEDNNNNSFTKQSEIKDDATYSNIDFNTHTLFFKSSPNETAFDTVTIKNTGKTCVYFKWEKNLIPSQIKEIKSDGIDRFFCHYSHTKIFPDEEKHFTFSFFSEKNGMFSEDWILKTTPPLKNCNLNLHLNGMVHLYVDNYSEKIHELNDDINKKSNVTKINEFVLDLIDDVKENEPELPNMNLEKNFKFYYEYLNKEYNVVFSKGVMKDLIKLYYNVYNELYHFDEEEKKENNDENQENQENNNENQENQENNNENNENNENKENKENENKENNKENKENNKENKNENKENNKENNENNENAENAENNENIEQPPEQKPPEIKMDPKYFWNGSLDILKEKISSIENEENRLHYTNLLNCIIHKSRRKEPEDSNVYDFIKNIYLEVLENINETSNEIREEMLLPPFTFDLLTRQNLDENDLKLYEADLKKKRDDFIKKSKKKPSKNPEDEQNELNEYRQRLSSKLTEQILNKITEIDKKNTEIKTKEEILNQNIFNNEYINRLTRIKCLRNIKNEGGLDNKFVVVRIDIENFKRIYIDDFDEEGKIIGHHFNKIDFLDTKDKMFESLSYVLNNGVKAALLLVDFGPKIGKNVPEFSLKDLKDYVEINLEHPCYFANNLDELYDFNVKIEEEELKDNCCIIMENLNFFEEEIGFETFQEDVINPNGITKKLCLYDKNKFIDNLIGKTTIFVNDSIFSFNKFYPSIIDFNNSNMKLKMMGLKIEEQMKKILDFFQIQNEKFILILGDNENYETLGRDENDERKDDEIVGESFVKNYDENCMRNNLLILSAIMIRFKKIFIFGKLAIQFIKFLRKDDQLFCGINKNNEENEENNENNNNNNNNNNNEDYSLKSNLFPLIKYILIKAYINNIEIILPNDFKILEKNEYNLHLEPMIDEQGMEQDYTKEIKLLLKRERVQRKLEITYTDEEELNDNADYIRIKLEDEQIESLKVYKEKTVNIERLPYCFDFIKEFDEAQGINKPKKMFKTQKEIYDFNEMIYDKEIVYPEEVVLSSEKHVKKEEERIEKIRLMKEEEEKKKLEEEQKEEEQKEEDKKEEEEKKDDKKDDKKEDKKDEKKDEKKYDKKDDKKEDEKEDEKEGEE